MYYDMMEGGGASLTALLVFGGLIAFLWWLDHR
jgi:hypothetical protein